MSTNTVVAQEDKVRMTIQLVKRFGCSLTSAQRTVDRCWPDVQKCEDEIMTKKLPCLIVFEVYCKQRELLMNLRETMLPIESSHLPFFRSEYLHELSNSYPTLTWGEIAQLINKSPQTTVLFLSCESGVSPNFEAYEEYYQQHILSEGLADIVGFTTVVDGLVPLMDYMNARHFSGMQPPQNCSLRGPPVVTPELCQTLYVSNETSEENIKTEITSTHLVKCRHRNLLGNNVFTSISQRQNKDGMQLTLKANGLLYIRGISGNTLEEVKSLRRKEHIPFPVIVKPVSGAGSEFVTLCFSEQDIEVFFNLIPGIKTTQMTEASNVLLQEYIEGQEYVVNVVSYEGKHVVSDVWKSWKYPSEVYSSRLLPAEEERMRAVFHNKGTGRLPVHVNSKAVLCDRLEFIHSLAEMNPNSEVRRVVDYTLQCIDALGMRQGCSHCEVRIDNRPDSKTKGMPVLVELNPRMLGDIPRATPFVGYNQYTLLMYLVLSAVAIPEDKVLIGSRGGDKDKKSTDDEHTYKMLPWPPAPLFYHSISTDIACHVIFFNVAERSVLCYSCVRSIMALSTFGYFTRDNSLDNLGKPGMLHCVSKTVDLLTSPLACVMMGPEKDIRRDMAFIRRVENKDLSECMSLLDTALSLKTTGQGDISTKSTMSHREVKYVSLSDKFELTKGNKNAYALNNISEYKAATKKVVDFFTCAIDLPLFVPMDYYLKLRAIGLEYLLLGLSEGTKKTNY